MKLLMLAAILAGPSWSFGDLADPARRDAPVTKDAAACRCGEDCHLPCFCGCEHKPDNLARAIEQVEAARRDDIKLIQAQEARITDLKAELKAAKTVAAPDGSLFISPYRVRLPTRYGWGWILTDGTFRPAYGDNPRLYDSGPEPRYQPAAQASASQSSCYSDSRGRRVCPRR